MAGVAIRKPEEIEKIADAARIVAEVLDELKRHARVGVSTRDLDMRAERLIRKRGGVPAFKGYHGYPATICASLNEEVVHGIPERRRRLTDGDILSIDVGVRKDGWHGDAALTVAVGKTDAISQQLMEVTEAALAAALAACRVGTHLGTVSHEIEKIAQEAGFSVVREWVGHGIGRKLHEEPQIPNYGTPGQGIRLAVGMILAIEPMVNIGGYKTKVLDDNWTVVTSDGSRSAHFEHTVAITEKGPRILTRRDDVKE